MSASVFALISSMIMLLIVTTALYGDRGLIIALGIIIMEVLIFAFLFGSTR